MNTRLLHGAALALALLAGCGGGSDGPAPEPVDGVPASATASPEAYAAFVGSLAADDRAEPLKLGALVPPTSESAEPIAVR